MELPGHKTHAKCPQTPGCATKQVFENLATGEYFIVHAKNGLKKHYCRVMGGTRPRQVFIGEWRNTVNNRIRLSGPHRLEDGAYNPPVDNNYKRDDWTLLGVYRGDITWIKVPKKR